MAIASRRDSHLTNLYVCKNVVIGTFLFFRGTRRSAVPFFRPDQIDSMHKAFENVCARLRLTGAKSIPVVELVAIRIVELAHAGEFNPDKLTEVVVAEFDG
jgi:hypothetical protein